MTVIDLRGTRTTTRCLLPVLKWPLGELAGFRALVTNPDDDGTGRRRRLAPLLCLLAMLAVPATAGAAPFHATYSGSFTITFATGPGLSDELRFAGSGAAIPGGPSTVDGYSTLRPAPGLAGVCFRTDRDEVTLAFPDGQLQLHNDARDCLDPLSRLGHPLIRGTGTWTVTGGTGAYAGAEGAGDVRVTAEVERFGLGSASGTFDPLVFDGELSLRPPPRD